MKKLYIVIICGILLSFVFGSTVFGQWTFTITRKGSGNCYLGIPPDGSLVEKVYPTKQECENVRQSLNGRVSQIYNGCNVTIVCGPCTGKDVANPNPSDPSDQPDISGNVNYKNPSNIDINGPIQGSAFFSSHPNTETVGWIDDANLRRQAFKNSNTSNFIPSTGNKKFDEIYAQASNNHIPVIEGTTVTHTQDVVIAPTIDNDRYMLLSGIEHDIQLALDELNRIDRYCKSYPSDCRSFQKRKEELEKKIGESKNNLFSLKSDDYNSATGLAELKKEIDNIKNEDYRTEFDKREEIANMRLDRINEQLKNREITSSQANAMIADVLAEKRKIDAERTVTDAYEWVKENKDVVVHGAIDVAEIAGHAAIEFGAAAATPGTFGASQGGKYIAHGSLTFAAELAHQVYDNGGTKSTGAIIMDAGRSTAISELKGAAIDKYMPVKIVVGGSKVNVMHTNMEGVVVYQTTKRIGGQQVANSAIWDAIEAGATIGWGIKK